MLVLCGVQQLYDHTGASDSFQMQVRSAFGILPATASCSLCTEESLRLTAHVWSLWQYHASGSHGMWSREENPSKITIRTLRSLKYTLMILTSSQEMLLLWQQCSRGVGWEEVGLARLRRRGRRTTREECTHAQCEGGACECCLQLEVCNKPAGFPLLRCLNSRAAGLWLVL